MRRRILCAVTGAVVPLLAGVAPALSKPPPVTTAPFTPPVGTLRVCSASGARVVTGAFTYVFATPASAGGSQTLSVSVGTCSVAIFYAQGLQVLVSETVPAGDSIAAIAIGGGGSTLASSSPTAGTATVTIGSGESALTFTTDGPPPKPPAHDCVVPNVVGLPLSAATLSLHKRTCKLGVLKRVYSRAIRSGRVISESPRRGSDLAPNAPVDLVVSRGPRP